MALGQKWVKILIVPLFRLKFDDVTVTLFDCIVMNFLQTSLDTVLLHTKIC